MMSVVVPEIERLGAAEAAAVDAIAERRALDLQEFGGARLGSVAPLPGPPYEIGLEVAQPIVERDRSGLLRQRGRRRDIRRLGAGAEQNARRHAPDPHGATRAGLRDPLAGVFELADIARPAVAHERLLDR